jgi:glucose/arabinose dehydrogenase
MKRSICLAVLVLATTLGVGACQQARMIVTPAPQSAPTAVPGSLDATVGLELVLDGLTSPLVYLPVPDGSGRFFVADQIGVIWIQAADGHLLPQPFLDLRDRMVQLSSQYDERGLLGLAPHPDYSQNGRFFVYYSAPLRSGAPADFNHTSHVSEFAVSGDPNVADPGSERIVLQIDEPQANHNAGQIAFGPDGYLYIPLGDGGGADDVGIGHVADWYTVNAGGNGQDIAQNLLGDILRVDIDGKQPYAIPPDNPFVGVPSALDEIWAYGLRNPYRISFDMGGDLELFAGDAGQNLWEEADLIVRGGNYGWNVKEGTHCFSTAHPDVSLSQCPQSDPQGNPLIDPIIEYQNANAPGGIGLVIIGGNVYRGSALPGYQGRYIFGDWSRSYQRGDGSLFVATRPVQPGAMWLVQELTIAGRTNGRINEFVLSFGQDADGEIYVLTTERIGPSGTTGKIYRLVP